MTGAWVSHDVRDAVVDYVRGWNEKTEISQGRLLLWMSLSRSKFYNWVGRYGQDTSGRAPIPRDFWLETWEKEAIVRFFHEHPLEGYRRLTYMMQDLGLVAVSPATTWRVLSGAGLLKKWNRRASRKGTGFVQPLKAHEHWHMDISYLNIHGTFYYLCTVLDGFSRFIVHWEIREQMLESDVEIILQRAREKVPQARPRIISDNGPQFISKDFKEFIRLTGMTHVRTSPFYPQSNGKLERFHQTIKGECIRPGVPLSLDEARRMVEKYIEHYNRHRLHSAIGYVAPHDKLMGKDLEIFKERDRLLEEARKRRRQKRREEANEKIPNSTALSLTQTA